MKRVLLAIAIAALSVLINYAGADGVNEQNDEWGAPSAGELERKSGSTAAFDKRLPPVLPGEVVGSPGEELKVWSSAGPVSVGPVPEPWTSSSPLALGPIGVVVDGRKNSRHHFDGGTKGVTQQGRSAGPE